MYDWHTPDIIVGVMWMVLNNFTISWSQAGGRTMSIGHRLMDQTTTFLQFFLSSFSAWSLQFCHSKKRRISVSKTILLVWSRSGLAYSAGLDQEIVSINGGRRCQEVSAHYTLWMNGSEEDRNETLCGHLSCWHAAHSGGVTDRNVSSMRTGLSFF